MLKSDFADQVRRITLARFGRKVFTDQHHRDDGTIEVRIHVIGRSAKTVLVHPTEERALDALHHLALSVD